MSAPSADILRWGRERVRTGQWRGEDHVAFLAPVPTAPLPSTEFVLRCLDVLAARGYTRVVTGALSPMEQSAFLAAGFDVAERLHLLSMDLTRLLPDLPPGLPLVRARAGDRGQVLAVDRAAFSSFWQFDDAGLGDALGATPRTRWRIAVPAGSRRSGGGIVGYAISGRAGPNGFVQRLAVLPGDQRQGTGRRLLVDGLRWMRRRRVQRVVVNTQLGNEPALALYRTVGFRDDPSGLSVLEAGIE